MARSCVASWHDEVVHSRRVDLMVPSASSRPYDRSEPCASYHNQ